MYSSLLCVLFLSLASTAMAKINVVTTTTDIGWAAKKIGGRYVDVQSLLTGDQDPHYVDALPGFILTVANADIVCSVGLDLEIGWLPRVLERAANTKVQPGGSGHCQLGAGITPMDLPTGKVDRSMGHVHAKGNPHFWLAPLALSKASAQILSALVKQAPEHKQFFTTNYEKLSVELAELDAKVKALMRDSDLRVLEYHEEFAYFLAAANLASYGSLEEKPGLPPSAARIANMAIYAKENKIDVILATKSTSKNTLRKFSRLSGRVTPVSVQISLPSVDGDYKEMILSLVDKMLATKPVSQKEKMVDDIRKG